MHASRWPTRGMLVAQLVAVGLSMGPLLSTTSAHPAKFREAPILVEQVQAGKLPPVEKRLPVDPLVVPVVEPPGQLGAPWARILLRSPY